MRQFSKKLVSIFLSVVLILGMFTTILPAMSLTTMAQNAVTEYDYTIVLNGVADDTSINDTRAVDIWDSDWNDKQGGINDFSTVGLERLGIWNAMGLDAAWGALGISKNFFNGTAVGAEADEIHPYIVYNVTPGTSFELSSAVHKESNADEFALTFYASNDGVTWVPINAERSLEGIWKSLRETWNSYNSYVYTIGNVGLRTNFIKVEYPITMTSRLADGALPEDKLLVYGAAFTPVENYAVNGQTLFEAESFARQKELYEKYFIAFPDFVNMDPGESTFNRAATTNSGMISGANWGSFDEKDRSYVAMVAPGSHFYLETNNNWYMKTVGEALVANGELESADQARIRVYSSASLSDDAAWTEWNPMPYSCGGPHTPTFNFYLPENHIYVRIVYPQKGSIATITKDGAQVVDASGNDAAFFNDMVFTPYVAAEAEYSRDYTGSDSVYEEVVAVNGGMGQSEYGVTIPWTNGKNLANDAAQNTEDPYAKGYFSVVYEVAGGKMFNLEYAVRLGNYGGTAGDGNTKGNYEANVTDGSSLEMIIESSADGLTWTGSYETESGYAQTTNSYNDCYAYDVSYLVPYSAKYVRVSMGITGVGYLADNSTYQGFNDCIYIRKVSVADANNIYGVTKDNSDKEFVYTTDTDASKATETSNTETAAIADVTGFRGDYAYLVAGDGANVKTLAGTLARPYVVYDVLPGSTFSFDYSMYATAKAVSEATAAMNIKAGLGSDNLKEFEFFVYGRRNKTGEWMYLGKTDSSTLDYNGGGYGTNGFGANSITVPAGINQIKVELPNTGAFTTATPVTYDYTTMSGDFGGWNYNNLGAFDTYNGGNADCKLFGNSGSGLGVHYGDAQGDWGTKSFYLIYAVQPGSTFVANFKMPDEATRNGYAEKTGEPFEFVVSAAAEWNGTYSNEATTAGQGTNATIGYRVPAGCNYVKVTFPQKGLIPELNYAANDNTFMTGASFYNNGAWVTAGNDAAYLYNVNRAVSATVKSDVEYNYITDTDATETNSTSNTATGEIDGATGFQGDYVYLVAGDGANVKTLAGTLARPYVVYDVVPGSEFSFDYAMRATAKAASEATAAFNIKAGFGSDDLKEFEFFVYGRKNESSDWTLIGKTDSSALDYKGGDTASYDTFGYGANSITVPTGVNQIKVELPNTGAFTTATPVTYDYTTFSGDFGGWNYNNLGAFDTYNGGNADCKLFGNSGLGLGVHYGDAQGDWGTKSFYLIYAVQPNSTFVANFKMPDAGTRNGYAEKTGEPFEFVVSAAAEWNGTYSNEATTAGQGTDATIGYRVPAGCNYVKVTFPTKGIIPEYNYVANDNTFFTGVSFYAPGAWVTAGNDAAYLYNVTFASSVKEDVEYTYTTDSEANKTNSTSNTATGAIDNATGFQGDYAYLVAGDGANVKTLAGTLERPYVIYNVVPGSEFSFDYAMRATAKAASEATAAFNINAGFGSEGLKEFEFFVYGRKNENSDWTYIGKTDSSALDYKGGDTASYDTFGYGENSITVPAGINQIKVELPNTGAFTTATPVTYDYTTMSGDFGGWNYNNLGAFDTYNGGNADCKLFGNSGLGLGVHYGDAQGDWGTKSFYLIYAVQPNSTFVANFKMPDEATRNGYAEKTGEPFEFVVSAAAEWNGTYSNEATTAGQGTNATIGYRVPAGCNYVKVTFPTKGIIPEYNYVANDNTFFTGVSFYNNGAWVTAGNDAAYLYNVTYAAGVVGGTEEDDTTGDDTTGDDTTGDDTVVDTNVIDYTAMGDANISSSNKEDLSIYNFNAVSVVNGNGVQANGDDAFVTYKIKEDTMLIINTVDALSFEYSVDDITYKAFDAVKTCAGYVIPAITGRNYIKVKLDNGEAIANTDAEVLGPTARFYIPYLDKYDVVDYAGYGVAANSVSSTINTLRPGYVFEEWSNYNSEEVYVDTLFEAVYTKDTAGDHTYTIEWTTDNGATTNSKECNFDDSISFTAPDTDANGKVFAKWVDANGVTVSNKQAFTLLVSGDLSLRAVYASAKADIDAHIYVTEKAIVKTSDSDSTRWNMSVVWSTELSEDVNIVETGIILGKDATKAELILVDGELQSGTTKLKHTNTDDNKTSMYTVKNIKAGATRTALPYAILSNGDEIYGDKVITVVGGTQREVSEDYLIDESISVDVLNNYLDRTASYDAFGSINGQTQTEAAADTKDFVRKTGAKQLARATGAWIPNTTDIYGDNFTNYTKWVSEVHEADSDVILEAAIFETVTSATDGLAIPKWVQEAFGLTYDSNLTFKHTEMMHDLTYFDWSSFSNKTYGENQWGTGIHVPSISKVQTQMYIYYRACTYIDMGFEAIHLGQMYRIGAASVSSAEKVNSVDLVNWELVLDKITEYAKTNARRGYVLFNGHTEDFVFENADGSQMLDYNLSPVRIQADASSGTVQVATSSSLQPVRLSKSSDGENVPYIDVVTNVTTRTGEECAYFPYLLEFDNFGHDASYKDKANTQSQYDYVWGYDEISWYANQDPTLRAAYLSTLTDSIKGLTDAPNGHVAMPGRRTAYISDTGCSEYKDLAWVQALMNSNGIAEVSLWEVSETDIAGIIAAWN